MSSSLDRMDSKPEVYEHEIPGTPGSEKIKDAEQDQGNAHDLDHGFTAEEVKAITKKIDWRIIPVLSMGYLISLIDRTNLAIARSANEMQMDRDLGLSSMVGKTLVANDRYSIITLMFFIPYIIFEVPSQYGLRAFGVRWWLGSAIFFWGVIMMCMGFSHDWKVMAALRALLGLFESALFPGAAFLISCWYPRKEMGSRNSIFYITSAVGGSFAKLIGYGFSHAHGQAGMSGWQWIFIFYGIATCLVAVLFWWLIVDFPDKATFLNEQERKIVITRIERDRRDSKPDPLTKDKLLKYACELQPWLFAIMFMGITMATYSLAYFLPTILATMGFTNVESMVLGTPAYFWAVFPAVGSGWVADRYKNWRARVIVINAVMLIVGTAMYSQLAASQKAARFAGIFLAVGGANSCVPLIISWQHTTIRAQSKRAYCSGLTVAFGGVGGILGSALFMEKERPKGYPTGTYTTFGVVSLSAIIAASLHFYFRAQNKKADRGEIVIGDHPEFRYQP